MATPSIIEPSAPGGPLPHRTKAGNARSPLACAMVVVLLLSQRLAIPIGSTGQLPLLIPVMLVLTILGRSTGALRFDPKLGALLGVFLATVAALSLVSSVRGQQASMLSIALLVAVYVPSVFYFSDGRAHRVASRITVDAMGVLGGVGSVLFFLQYAGVGYTDYVAQVVPEQYVVRGFVTSYPLEYGSNIFRSNGVIFLEASFFSLFLGIALVLCVATKYHRGWIPILLLALGCSVSGNGIVLAVACVAGMALRPKTRRSLRVLAIPALIAVVCLVTTPVGEVLASRATEIDSPRSSAYSRIIGPYTSLVPAVTSSPVAALIGHGAGQTDAYLRANFLDAEGNPPIISSAIPKLFFEFGALGAVPGLLFLGAIFVRGIRSPLFLGTLVCFFVINASLLQAALATATTLYLTTLRTSDVTALDYSRGATD